MSWSNNTKEIKIDELNLQMILYNLSNEVKNWTWYITLKKKYERWNGRLNQQVKYQIYYGANKKIRRHLIDRKRKI